jgi:hypothetical protein
MIQQFEGRAERFKEFKQRILSFMAKKFFQEDQLRLSDFYQEVEVDVVCLACSKWALVR